MDLVILEDVFEHLFELYTLHLLLVRTRSSGEMIERCEKITEAR